MWECVSPRPCGQERYSERSSLHDVRYHASDACLASKPASPSCNQIRICFLTDEILTSALHQPAFAKSFGGQPSRSEGWLANRSGVGREGWWSQTGSNRRPPACKAGALPAELWPQKSEARLACQSKLAETALASPFRLRRAVFTSLRE